MQEQKTLGPHQLKVFLIRVIQGAVIGAGAILPGISGGVLAVAFGIYQPMMAVLAKPFQNIKIYWKMFIPITIGWAIGFLGLAGAIAKVLSINATVVVSLFIGLILGTFPSLFQEGSKNGRSKSMWVALIISTVVLLAFFYTLKFSTQTTVTPSFGWYIFCGVLWGFSLIIPGMSSSSTLLFLGLYQPMSEGIATMNFQVLIPFAIGILGTVLLLARLVNMLFGRHNGVAFFCVIGFVIASTIPIIPTAFAGVGEALLSILAVVVGFVASYFLERMGLKQPEHARDEQANLES